LSDGQQSLTTEEFEQLIKDVKRVAESVGRAL